MKSLVIASHNSGKVSEIGLLLAPLGINVHSAKELHLPEPDETGDSFADNARIKSVSAASLSHMPALADDSGLCVNALGNAPGIYSARWAGKDKDFTMAMKRIEQELIAVRGSAEGAEAYFVCVLSLTLPDGTTEIFEGRIDGTLTFPPRGEKGFGYDPIFVPNGHNVTFAQMEGESKHAISHRAKAFAAFVQYLQKENKSA